MPDWRDNQIEDNIRNGFVQSSTHDANASIKKSRLELETTPTNDLTRNHITTNNDGFGVITNKSFENGSTSGARGLVENAGNGTCYGENDFAYYDWPAIDNFEDVDRLFRNCDSTFGQKETMEDGGEELSWFATSSDAIYTSEMEALNDFATYSSGKPGLQTSPAAEGENAFASTQMECQGEEIDQLVVNETYNGEGSLNGYGTLDMTGSPHLPVQKTQDFIDQKCLLVSPSKLNNAPILQDQKHLLESGASSYLTFNSFTPGMEASPSQVQPPTPKGPSALQKKTEKLKNGQLRNMIEQPPMEKPSFGGSNCKDKFENGVDESKSILDSSVLLNGSSSNSSTFSTNDLSVEENSFRQLQDVMNQLDVQTKLCIRDSLYRLARSVQHRNDFSSGSKSYGNGHAQYSAMNNGFVEPINSETGTNPIDRSIAELLFHQPPCPNPNPNSNIGNIEDANSPKSRVSSE